jgi:branched-chain amino acid transport system ATP-binding protein
MDAVFKLCDRVVVLDYGRKIAEGLPQEIAHDKVVVEAYLGEPVD